MLFIQRSLNFHFISSFFGKRENLVNLKKLHKLNVLRDLGSISILSYSSIAIFFLYIFSHSHTRSMTVYCVHCTLHTFMCTYTYKDIDIWQGLKPTILLAFVIINYNGIERYLYWYILLNDFSVEDVMNMCCWHMWKTT